MATSILSQYILPADFAAALRAPVLRHPGDTIPLSVLTEIFDGDGAGKALGLSVTDLDNGSGVVEYVDALTYIEGKSLAAAQQPGA